MRSLALCLRNEGHAAASGNVVLGKVSSRYFLVSTSLTPLRLFNPQVTELQAGPVTHRCVLERFLLT
jgi:hypothetical protein